MTHHDHEHHGHHDHVAKRKGLHKDWRTWLIVALALAAILMYVLSDDESLEPGDPQPQERVPAAAGP